MKWPKLKLKLKKKKKKLEIIQELEEEDLIKAIEKMSKVKVKELSSNELKNFRKRVIGKKISEEFSYNEIKGTIDEPKKSKGAAVYGYVLKNFKDGKDLIKNDYIFDIACHYAKRVWLPTPQYLMKKIDLDKYIKTGLLFGKTYCFDHFSDQPFNEAIVYAPDTWSESITWERRVKWYIDGWVARVNVGKSNIMILDWATFDIPMLIILHSPGKDFGLYKTNFKTEEELDIDAVKEDQMKIDLLKEQNRQLLNEVVVIRKVSEEQQKLIHKSQSKLAPLRHKIDSKTQRLDRMTEAASEFRERFNTLEPISIVQDINKTESLIMNPEMDNVINTKSIVGIIIFIALVVIFGFLAFTMGGGQGIDPTNSTIPVDPIELNNILMMLLWVK